MAKTLTDKELADIISRATSDKRIIDCADSYKHFLEDLTKLVCDHFGGDPGVVSAPYDIEKNVIDSDKNIINEWTTGIHINECVPDDGGIYNYYDTDIVWKNGDETDVSGNKNANIDIQTLSMLKRKLRNDIISFIYKSVNMFQETTSVQVENICIQTINSEEIGGKKSFLIRNIAIDLDI